MKISELHQRVGSSFMAYLLSLIVKCKGCSDLIVAQNIFFHRQALQAFHSTDAQGMMQLNGFQGQMLSTTFDPLCGLYRYVASICQPPSP
jgi:hypothetical protein